MRFLFLCDSHALEGGNPVLRRVFDWVGDHVRASRSDALILGGDMTHHASVEQADWVLRRFSPCGPIPVFLPGNNEGPTLNWNALKGACRPVPEPVRLDWPGCVFALPTADEPSMTRSLRFLAHHLPDRGRVLVFAHMPPRFGQGDLGVLDKPGLDIIWICGHTHDSRSVRIGSFRIERLACLDPVKARGTLPEIGLGNWDGDRLGLERISMDPVRLKGAEAAHPYSVGLACGGDARVLLERAITHRVSSLQFGNGPVRESPTSAERDAAQRFKTASPGGVLSLHLPVMPDPGETGPPVAAWEQALGWAEGMRVDDLTVHLPKRPVSELFASDGSWRRSAWANGYRDSLLTLAERVLAMGSGLSLENMYNKGCVSPEEELLSSRPWHLIRLLEWLRLTLREKGHVPSAVSRIGLLLDAGHAFRDPVVSKTHGLGDWIARLAPYMRGAHLHQVEESDGVLVNHAPIRHPWGPRINYAGLLPLFRELVPVPIPLYVEVRDVEAALESREVLQPL